MCDQCNGEEYYLGDGCYSTCPFCDGEAHVTIGKWKGTPYDKVPKPYCDWVASLDTFADKKFHTWLTQGNEIELSVYHFITEKLIMADHKEHRFDNGTYDAWWPDKFNPVKALEYAMEKSGIPIPLSPTMRAEFVKNWKPIMTKCTKEMQRYW